MMCYQVLIGKWRNSNATTGTRQNMSKITPSQTGSIHTVCVREEERWLGWTCWWLHGMTVFTVSVVEWPLDHMTDELKPHLETEIFSNVFHVLWTAYFVLGWGNVSKTSKDRMNKALKVFNQHGRCRLRWPFVLWESLEDGSIECREPHKAMISIIFVSYMFILYVYLYLMVQL